MMHEDVQLIRGAFVYKIILKKNTLVCRKNFEFVAGKIESILGKNPKKS